MREIKKYDEFIKEEFIGSLLAAAKGVFKNFLNSLTAPFKEFSNEFKKEMKKEEIRKKISELLDDILKISTDNINKAEDENAINQIKDALSKEITDRVTELDNNIKATNESLIKEGIKDTMIGGRVLMNMVKAKADEYKIEFDKKFAEAKDLATKKKSAIDYINKVVSESKKKMLDDKYISDLINKYKTDNKIKTTESTYKVGDVVIYLRKGKTIEMWNRLTADQKVNVEEAPASDIVGYKSITKIDGNSFTFVGKKGSIIKDISDIIGKKVDSNLVDVSDDVKQKLSSVKSDAGKMSKIDKYIDFINKPENKDKVVDIEKIIDDSNIE